MTTDEDPPRLWTGKITGRSYDNSGVATDAHEFTFWGVEGADIGNAMTRMLVSAAQQTRERGYKWLDVTKIAVDEMVEK